IPGKVGGGVPRGTRGPRKEVSLKKIPDIPVPSAEFLAGLIAGAGLSVPQGAVLKLIAHAREMLRWNRSIRLTAITDPEEVAVKHVLDSLLLLRFTPFPGRILDFGSGAGYPGIPLGGSPPRATRPPPGVLGKKGRFPAAPPPYPLPSQRGSGSG